MDLHGVGGAITAQQAITGLSPATGGAARVRANPHPLRSGDIYLYQEPYWFMFDRGAVAAMHGSPWNYDSHVPLIFVGQRIKPARVDREVNLVDVAPTLSALLGIPVPAGAQGQVLTEVTSR